MSSSCNNLAGYRRSRAVAGSRLFFREADLTSISQRIGLQFSEAAHSQGYSRYSFNAKQASARVMRAKFRGRHVQIVMGAASRSTFLQKGFLIFSHATQRDRNVCSGGEWQQLTLKNFCGVNTRDGNCEKVTAPRQGLNHGTCGNFIFAKTR